MNYSNNSHVLTSVSGPYNQDTFQTTCHGAGRLLSRSSAKKMYELNSHESKNNSSHLSVMEEMKNLGICLRVHSPEDIAEEGHLAYKDVNQVIEVCKFYEISV